MSSPVVLIPTDLSRVLVFGPDVSDRWESPPTPADADVLTAARGRVDGATRFIGENPLVRRRVSEVVVDIDESECLWTRTTSVAPAVLANALRRRSEEWSGVFPVGGVHPLVGPDPEAHAGANRRGLLASITRAKNTEQAAQRERGVAVLTMPDAVVRLFLDALDRAGVRVAGVTSLYHALARFAAERGASGGDSGGSHAAVLIEPGERIVWAWSRGGRLVACGRIALHTHHDPRGTPERGPDEAVQRLALDWSAWAAYLSDAPVSCVAVVPDQPAEAGDDSRRLLPNLISERVGIPVRIETAVDPLALLARGREGAARGDGPGWTLSRLAARPTKATRRRYLVAAATLAIGAAAAAGVGHRFQDAADARIDAARDASDRLRAWVNEEVPGIDVPRGQSAIAALRRTLEELRDREPFTEPPEPRPLKPVIASFLEVISQPAFEGVQLQSISVGDGPGQIRATIDGVDRAFATELNFAIESIDGPVRWERTTVAGDRREFRGEWRR